MSEDSQEEGFRESWARDQQEYRPERSCLPILGVLALILLLIGLYILL